MLDVSGAGRTARARGRGGRQQVPARARQAASWSHHPGTRRHSARVGSRAFRSRSRSPPPRGAGHRGPPTLPDVWPSTSIPPSRTSHRWKPTSSSFRRPGGPPPSTGVGQSLEHPELTWADVEKKQRLWWFLLLAGVVALLGEAVLSNRLSPKFGAGLGGRATELSQDRRGIVTTDAAESPQGPV